MPPKHAGEHEGGRGDQHGRGGHHGGGEGKRAELREDITEVREWIGKIADARQAGNQNKAHELREKMEQARKEHFRDANAMDRYEPLSDQDLNQRVQQWESNEPGGGHGQGGHGGRGDHEGGRGDHEGGRGGRGGHGRGGHQGND